MLGCQSIGQTKKAFKKPNQGKCGMLKFSRKKIKKAGEKCLGFCGGRNCLSFQVTANKKNKRKWTCRCFGVKKLMKKEKRPSLVGRWIKCSGKNILT